MEIGLAIQPGNGYNDIRLGNVPGGIAVYNGEIAMTAVEIGQEYAQRRIAQISYFALDEEAQDGGGAESLIPVRQVKSPTVTECGISYQQCGGGRRVIRKQKGGN